MRDLKADWKRWSISERTAAILMFTGYLAAASFLALRVLPGASFA